MRDLRRELQFGIFVTPLAAQAEAVLELGLGAGAFWDGVAAMGGRRLTPGQSVDALSEAVDVIRQLWSQESGSVRLEGEHYRVVGAQRGPPPVHAVEIWLGAYKPRMLALTGAKADGWLPSLGYADPAELAAMGARIDEAAERAGRPPGDVRRMYNINGEFGSGRGFLQGSPAAWAEQLAALTFEAGVSSFILSAGSDHEVRVFAEEVAPAVRELVETERGREAVPALAASGPPTGGGQRAAAFTVTPTPDDGARLSDAEPWDEASRPRRARRRRRTLVH